MLADIDDDGGAMRPHSKDARDVWSRIGEIGSAHHIVAWMVILEAERDGVDRINSTTVIHRLFRWTGKIPSSDRVLRSMNRLEEFGIIEREPVDDHPTACHWTTTEEGRKFATAIAEAWLSVLEWDRADGDSTD